MREKRRPVRRVEAGDVPLESAARRLGLTAAEFESFRDKLERRGFPGADPTTDLYDLDAIDAWRRGRNPLLFGQTGILTAVDARTSIVATRLAQLDKERPGRRGKKT